MDERITCTVQQDGSGPYSPELLSQLEEEDDQIQCSLPDYLTSVFSLPTTGISHAPDSSCHKLDPSPHKPVLKVDSSSCTLNSSLCESDTSVHKQCCKLGPSPHKLDSSCHKLSPSSNKLDPSCHQLSPSSHKLDPSSQSKHSRKLKRSSNTTSPKRKKQKSGWGNEYEAPPTCIPIKQCHMTPVGVQVSLLGLVMQGELA